MLAPASAVGAAAKAMRDGGVSKNGCGGTVTSPDMSAPDPVSTARPETSRKAAMLQHRHVGADAGGQRRVDAGGGPADPVGDLRDHRSPRVADQGVPVGEARAALGVEV